MQWANNIRLDGASGGVDGVRHALRETWALHYTPFLTTYKFLESQEKLELFQTLQRFISGQTPSIVLPWNPECM